MELDVASLGPDPCRDSQSHTCVRCDVASLSQPWATWTRPTADFGILGLASSSLDAGKNVSSRKLKEGCMFVFVLRREVHMADPGRFLVAKRGYLDSEERCYANRIIGKWPNVFSPGFGRREIFRKIPSVKFFNSFET